MEHSFDIDLANEIGIEEAIIFKHIVFWIEKNRANGKNFFDGEYWTYNSTDAFREIFFYMSPNKVRTALEKLRRLDYIKTGNFNSIAYDRTTWYAIGETGKSICENHQIHLRKSTNGSEEIHRPIPNNNTYINTNNKTDIYAQKASDEIFERLWKLYPCKRGKGQVSDKRKRDIANLIGEEQFGRCIQRYMKEHEKLSSSGKFCPEWMNGSTFFHSGYIDYLDENCTTEQEKKTAKRKDEDPPIDEWTEQ